MLEQLNVESKAVGLEINLSKTHVQQPHREEWPKHHNQSVSTENGHLIYISSQLVTTDSSKRHEVKWLLEGPCQYSNANSQTV